MFPLAISIWIRAKTQKYIDMNEEVNKNQQEVISPLSATAQDRLQK